MISLDTARQRVLADIERLHPRAVPLREALGCATSVPLHAPEHVPPFDNTAVDGYAVHAADTADAPCELDVVGTLAAGSAWTAPLREGTALRIMTGAPLPPGADAVVMVEDSERLDAEGHRVRLARSVGAGDGIRRAGDDVREGELVFDRGTIIQPAHIGVLASMGFAKVPVFPRARVGVLSTGDELVEGGAPLAPGQIRESNRGMLLGLAAQANCEPVDLGTARDDETVIADTIQRGMATCDALLSSGGVSMGDFDLVKVVLDRIGRMQWMQVAIRPAKPFAFGILETDGRRVPVFGLPGNPVSSLVSFELLARPALRMMMGHPVIDRPRVLAVADDGLGRRPDGKTHFVRVAGRFSDDGRYHVRSTGAQGSHQLASTAAAAALAVVPDGEGVPPGGSVEVVLLWG